MPSLSFSTYSIHIENIGPSLCRLVNEGNYSQVAILVDENTRRHCLPILLEKIDFETFVIEIPSGEQNKNLDICRLVWEKLMSFGLDRKSLFINLGGGVIGDLGGFCAATYLRGIDFVQVPTTLLAQVDASTGGKLGVDFNFVKNSIGVFQNPKAVFIEPAFLKTLPEREIRSGFAEIIKHALIADIALWEKLQSLSDLRQVDWQEFLMPSLDVKKLIVEDDPLEKGLRKTLNFGHTVGHAVESFFLKTGVSLTHGEAVAIGLVCESWLSSEIAGLPQKDLEQITGFIKRIYSSFPCKPEDFSSLFDLMKKDKKNEAGKINFTLLTSIGNAVIDQFVEEDLIEMGLEFYRYHFLNY